MSHGKNRIMVRSAASLVMVISVGAGPLTSIAGAAAAPVAPAVQEASAPMENQFTDLVGAIRERIMLADMVAAAKFGTTSPIDDPVRERQVVDRVAVLAGEWGLDPVEVTNFFRLQIEASKYVQRGLFDLWTTDPSTLPAERPDLVSEVRPKLDQLTGRLLEQLKATAPLRSSTVECAAQLARAEAHAVVEYRLDQLHRAALLQATESLCRGNLGASSNTQWA